MRTLRVILVVEVAGTKTEERKAASVIKSMGTHFSGLLSPYLVNEDGDGCVTVRVGDIEEA